MSPTIASVAVASTFAAAVPDCDSTRQGSWVMMPEIVQTVPLPELIDRYKPALQGKNPFCKAAAEVGDDGLITLMLRYTGCLPGMVWFCETGVSSESEISDFSNVICRLPKQYDTCHTY